MSRVGYVAILGRAKIWRRSVEMYTTSNFKVNVDYYFAICDNEIMVNNEPLLPVTAVTVSTFPCRVRLIYTRRSRTKRIPLP